jgi:hypothetical protein
MNTGRVAAPGKTRTCPHCKATILESAAVCPGCQHHLRFDPAAAGQRAPSRTPLKVEGTIKPPAGAGACEYSVVLAIRNARGEEITRQVVGVGAIQPLEERTFSLSVEVFTAAEVRAPTPERTDPRSATGPHPRPTWPLPATAGDPRATPTRPPQANGGAEASPRPAASTTPPAGGIARREPPSAPDRRAGWPLPSTQDARPAGPATRSAGSAPGAKTNATGLSAGGASPRPPSRAGTSGSTTPPRNVGAQEPPKPPKPDSGTSPKR